MEIRADARFPFPRPAVFAAYRDHITDLLPYLPNVRKIEVKSRVELGAVTKLVSAWHGGGDIPAAARAVLSESMLGWDDHAEWNAEEFTCKWTIHTHSFTDAVTCAGTNVFREDGAQTILEIRGSIEIDAKKIRGVPGFLAGRVGKTVEDVLAGKIQPNLAHTADGLRKYLEAAR